MIMDKTCSKCKKTKPTDEFYFRKDRGKYHGQCKECIKEYQKNNKGKKAEYDKEYAQNNKEKIYEYQRNRRKTDPRYRLNANTKTAIGVSLHGNKNGRHWEDLVGYTLDNLKEHLESQFTDGMTWDNYGKWSIDHFIPISAFNFTKPEHLDFKRCWALENLQPLWAEENMSKHTKLFCDFQSNLAI